MYFLCEIQAKTDLPERGIDKESIDAVLLHQVDGKLSRVAVKAHYSVRQTLDHRYFWYKKDERSKPEWTKTVWGIEIELSEVVNISVLPDEEALVILKNLRQ